MLGLFFIVAAAYLGMRLLTMEVTAFRLILIGSSYGLYNYLSNGVM